MDNHKDEPQFRISELDHAASGAPYTVEHVERTIALERRLGLIDGKCAFLGQYSVDDDQAT